MTTSPLAVLFVCKGNHARSIMAEAIMRRMAGKFAVYSAGSQPRPEINPFVVRLLKSLNHDLAGLRPKSWDEFAKPGAPPLDFVFTLSVIAIIYTSLVALMQEDIKKLIAYSSVAHMGFVTMGLFTLTPQGIQGAMFQMVSHGLVSGALFLCVGVIYDRMHTREIAAYGGLVNRMPVYAVIFMVFTMANVGLPGTAGFVGEFLTLMGAFRANPWVAFIACSGVRHSPAPSTVPRLVLRVTMVNRFWNGFTVQTGLSEEAAGWCPSSSQVRIG